MTLDELFHRALTLRIERPELCGQQVYLQPDGSSGGVRTVRELRVVSEMTRNYVLVCQYASTPVPEPEPTPAPENLEIIQGHVFCRGKRHRPGHTHQWRAIWIDPADEATVVEFMGDHPELTADQVTDELLTIGHYECVDCEAIAREVTDAA